MYDTFLACYKKGEKKELKETFCFIGINYYSQDYLKGVDEAAKYIREYSLQYMNPDESAFPHKQYNPDYGEILSDCCIKDYGDITAESDDELYKGLSKIEYPNGAIPIFVGGDHAVTYSLVKYLDWKKHNEDIVVVQFDAHSDTVDAYAEDPHGSVMNMVDTLHRVKKIIHFGVRGNLNCRNGIKKSTTRGNIFVPYSKANEEFEKVLKAVRGEKIYITFDTDFFTPSEAPATNCLEPGGPMYTEGLEYLRQVIEESGSVIGMDVVEYNPTLEGKFQTGNMLVNLIMMAMSYISTKNKKENIQSINKIEKEDKETEQEDEQLRIKKENERRIKQKFQPRTYERKKFRKSKGK